MLGCIQPMSSPMMNRMLGFCVVCAALGVEPQPIKKLEMARAPSASFRTIAPCSMVYLLVNKSGWTSAREDCDGLVPRPTQSIHQVSPASNLAFASAKGG